MKTVAIEEAFEFVRNGLSVKQEDGKTGIPITRIETIWNSNIDKGRFGYADITEEKLKDIERYLLNEGDILMTHINSPKHLGKCAIYNNEPKKLIHGMNLLCLRPKAEILFPKYAMYFFNSGRFRSVIPRISNQSVNQASFSAGNLKDIQIPLPPLFTQKKIAAILDAADVYRQKTKTLIEKYDQLAQALFLDMFGDTRFNPKHWPVHNLEEICSNIVDCPHSTPKYVEEITDYPCIRTTELKNGNIEWRSMKYLDIQGHKERTKRIEPIEGDIIYGREGTIGEAIIVPHSTNISLGQRVMLFRPKFEVVLSVFLHSVIRSSGVYNQALSLNTGSTVAHVNVADIKKFQIILPPMSLQNQFSERAQLIEKQKQQAQASLQKAEDLFNSLLQSAFKGELVKE